MADNETRPVKKQVSVTLNNDVVEKLKELADEDDRTLSGYVNHILRKELNRID
ncbi:MAG: ribbon-helix-helix domain-containing protein [Eubacterium sp.]